ncbi:hypothetical protein BKA83DRAFT_4126638 [Pisolithus microcarpus]|nr:hypothetical protein BKA83DRAFT_4126638 [Pisolithus microcarpus]
MSAFHLGHTVESLQNWLIKVELVREVGGEHKPRMLVSREVAEICVLVQLSGVANCYGLEDIRWHRAVSFAGNGDLGTRKAIFPLWIAVMLWAIRSIRGCAVGSAREEASALGNGGLPMDDASEVNSNLTSLS